MDDYANREFSLGKGLMCGLIGGLVGTILMTEFQNAWSRTQQELKGPKGTRYDSDGEDKSEEGEKEDATMKAAGKAAALFGQELSHETKKKLGPLVHYGFGTAQGAVYGMLLEACGSSGGLIAGLTLGAALFALADEYAVPALGLSGKPSEYPLPTHVYALVSHLVYGLSAETMRRGVRASI